MDRNQATGLILISLLVIIYFQFFAPKPPQLEEQKEITESQTSDTTNQSTISMAAPEQELDSSQQAQKITQLGDFAQAAEGTEEIITLNNKDLEIEFSNKGGAITQILLKDYLTYEKEPLVLIDKESAQQRAFIATNSGIINLSDLYYTASQEEINDSTQLRYRLDIAPGRYIEHSYTLAPTGFEVQYAFTHKGMESSLVNKELRVEWDYKMKRFEQEIDKSRQMSSINYFTSEYDNLDETSTDPEEVKLNEPAKWISFKQKFFTTGVLSSKGLDRVSVKTSIPANDSSIVKIARAEYTLALDENGSNLKYYFGPNNYQILKKMPNDFSENVDLGWPVISWFNKWMIVPLFNFLENYISNYGIIILILVFIVKLALSPLSYKSYVSMAKMKVINNLIKPDLDAFKEKQGNDQSKVQQEQMRLYQNLGISPLASMSGCVPLLLQMPILLAMFNFFPNSIELRQESFLWAHDLSTYDNILDLPFTIPFYGAHVSLFTLLMTISTLVVTHFNSQNTAAVQGPMKTMQYMMPVMFLFFLNSFASGLTFYYFIANLITFGQQIIIKRFVDEDKIKTMVESNRTQNKGKKKSKFQQRLEDAMKAKEEDLKNKKKKAGKK